MSVKTHPFTDASDQYDKRHDGGVSPLLDFVKSPLVITKKMISKANQNRGKSKNSSELSSSSGISRSDQMIIINRNNSKPRNLKLSSSLGSLMADMPLSPPPVCSSPTESETIFSSPSSNLPCDCSRASGDCHSPTHQSSSMSFRKQEQSPKCMSISTIYESAIDHNHRGRAFDSHGYALGTTYSYSPKSLASLLAPYHHGYESSTATATTTTANSGHAPDLLSVIQDPAGRRRRRRQSGRAGQFTRAIPVRTDQQVEDEEEHPTPVSRPKPYHEFLDEVQSLRRNAELSARRKAVSTRLFDQLRRKETAIDDWESKQRNKQEFQLDKLETKLDKKRAKAVQKMHQRVAEINVEAERKKAKERRSFLKKMDRLSGQTQENKARVKMLFHPWSCCCIPVPVENPDSNQVAIF